MIVVVAVVGAALVALALQQTVPAWFLAPLVPTVAAAVAAHLRSRRFLPLLAIALAVTPFPAAVPRLLPLGGRQVFITDLVLPAVAVLALRTPSRAPGPDRTIRAYGFIMVLLALRGLLGGVDLNALIQDFRGPLYLVCGYLVGSRLLDITDRTVITRTVSAILWWSTAMIFLSLFTGRELLAGRVGETQAFAGGDTKTGLDAIRFLIASKELALIAMVAGLSGLLIGRVHRVGWRGFVAVILPAFVVLFMAFSRQSVIGLGAGLLVILAASPLHILSVRRLVTGGAMLVVVAGVLGLSGIGQRVTDPTQGVLGKQVEGFTERVVGGLFGENLVDDPGNRFRTLEIEAAIDYASAHPVVGGGLGVTYRDELELEAFKDQEYGARYVHNVYLWYAVKGGLMGLIAIGLLLGAPLVRSLVPATLGPVPYREERLALGAALAAVVVIGLVEPVIHLTTTAPLVGALVGVLGVFDSSRETSGLDAASAQAR